MKKMKKFKKQKILKTRKPWEHEHKEEEDNKIIL